MATLIKPDGIEKEVYPNNVKKGFTVEELQKLIGGFFELISPARPMERYMLCNEDGRAMRLPFNARASEICGREIVGDVLLCDRKEFH